MWVWDYHWSIVNLPGTTPLKKMYSFFHQPSVVGSSSVRGGADACLFTLLEYDRLDLVQVLWRQSRLLRVCVCNGPVCPKDKVLLICSPTLILHLSAPSSKLVPELWGKGTWCRCVLHCWALSRHLLSALWQVSFCVNRSLLHNEPPQIRSEYCTHLGVCLYSEYYIYTWPLWLPFSVSREVSTAVKSVFSL